MSLSLTPHMLAAAYAYLRECSPFKAWGLPLADEVEFCVTRHRDREADHNTRSRAKEHIIRVSSYAVKTTDGLMQAMAHEMIHARQAIDGTANRAQHNAEFKRLANRVCRQHGWKYDTFLDWLP